MLDQGKTREISLFSLESAKSAPQPASLPQNTFSDLPQYGASTPSSITIVLLDNLNTLYGSAPGPYETTPTWFEDLALTNAKAHLIEFLKQLQPQDRVAIYGLSDSLHVLCDFTSDRDQLLAIVGRYDTSSIRTVRELSTASDVGCRDVLKLKYLGYGRRRMQRFWLLVVGVVVTCQLGLRAGEVQHRGFSDLPDAAQTLIATLLAKKVPRRPGPTRAQLRASNAHRGNLFGFAVAVSGNTIVVASHGFRNYPGGAYVFVKPPSGWQEMTETAELIGTDWQGAVGFGSVAISGDTIVAGPSADGFGAYVFVRPPGGWANATPTATLAADESLGTVFSVAVSGNTVALGYANGNQAGAAALFVKPADGWHDMAQTAILTASDAAPGDQLGTSVAVGGDTVIAGAPYAAVNSVPGAGAVYVFVRPATGWQDMTQTAKLTPTYDIGGLLGFTTSISGNTVVASGDGNVYVFVEPSTGWVDMTPTAALEPPTGQDGVSCAAISGGAVVAGSPGGYPYYYGEVYAFLEPPSGWQTTSSPNEFYAGTSAGGPQMIGYSVAVSGSTAVAGAPGSGNNKGVAYVVAPQ